MIKKVIPILGVLLFAWAILIISIRRTIVEAQPSLAAAGLKFSVSPTEETTISSKAKVDYYLVYPGILPDHALYKLKMVRDRIWLWLTTNPLKKTELLLLYADKRVGAGKALIEGNKVPLGLSTLIKGEKYLEKVVTQLAKAKERGEKIAALSEQVKKASLKHEEILLELKEKVNPDGQAVIEDLMKFVKTLQERVENL